jgi:hypothetical protein
MEEGLYEGVCVDVRHVMARGGLFKGGERGFQRSAGAGARLEGDGMALY